MPCAQDAYLRHIARHGGRNDSVDLGGLINRVEMTVHRHGRNCDDRVLPCRGRNHGHRGQQDRPGHRGDDQMWSGSGPVPDQHDTPVDSNPEQHTMGAPPQQQLAVARYFNHLPLVGPKAGQHLVPETKRLCVLP
jgi:hypothetical protein